MTAKQSPGSRNELLSRPVREMRDIDMLGRPAVALQELVRDVINFQVAAKQLTDAQAEIIDRMGLLPESMYAELNERFDAFILRHKPVFAEVRQLAGLTAALAKQISETKESETERFNALMGANGVLVEAYKAAAKDHAEAVGAHANAVNQLNALFDRSLWELFRAWLARRISR